MLCAIKFKLSNNELIFDKYCSSKRKIEFDWDFRTENLIRATILIRQNVNFLHHIIVLLFCIISASNHDGFPWQMHFFMRLELILIKT